MTIKTFNDIIKYIQKKGRQQMKTLIVEMNPVNYKLINKTANITVIEFCGYLNIIGAEKTIKKLAKKMKVFV